MHGHLETRMRRHIFKARRLTGTMLLLQGLVLGCGGFKLSRSLRSMLLVPLLGSVCSRCRCRRRCRPLSQGCAKGRKHLRREASGYLSCMKPSQEPI
jgi:hypothetical protein